MGASEFSANTDNGYGNLVNADSSLNVAAALGAPYETLVEQTKATLGRIAADFSPAVFASSLAAEDMVLTDLILRSSLPIRIFTLETGRLHKETLGVMQQIHERYGYGIEMFRPDPAAVDQYVREHGLNAFYDSVELRKQCCRIRKVDPLNRALKGNVAWVTGQRRAQSTTRLGLDVQEQDSAHGMTKFNPLADWSEEDVWHYIRSNNVPYNPLHDRGYPSIGCEPCTRAIQPGEDVRAGRWWWENADSKECGLHVVDGKLVRLAKAAPDPVVDAMPGLRGAPVGAQASVNSTDVAAASSEKNAGHSSRATIAMNVTNETAEANAPAETRTGQSGSGLPASTDTARS